MRTLLTGATGFLGTALLRKLTGPVVALVRDHCPALASECQPAPLPAATYCTGDVVGLSNIERIIAEYEIEAIIHLAGQTEVRTAATDPLGTWETNVRGTWVVLEAARRQGVARVLLASSDKAYGRTPPPYREDDPLRTDRPYDTSKACADLIARTYADTWGMSVAVTRCVNLYGPGCLTRSTLIPNTIRRVLRGEAPFIRNGGQMQRDWLYIDDAVTAYQSLLASDYVGAMNFGGGAGVSVRTIVDLILELMDSPLIPTDEPDHLGEITHQWSDTTCARETLGWAPAVSLREGLIRTIAWYREHYQPCR